VDEEAAAVSLLPESAEFPEEPFEE